MQETQNTPGEQARRPGQADPDGAAPRPPHDPEFDQELLDTGQEEVFSRTEAELGRIEHASEAGRHEKPALR